MFKSLGNIANLMKQAQEMKSRMGELEGKLAEIRVKGSAGGSMVEVEANGQQKVFSVRIDDSLLDDREMLEDLVTAATNDALQKAKQAAAEQMSEITGGMDMPGMEEIMKNFNPNTSGA
ncbi:MAG: YbaB/EbfC family nucleoid-associated protein [Planctomycetaceae bacterium]|nr:YbaB/EbfC family nucleoid-associated protein [Planctomycetaceae bacterium]